MPSTRPTITQTALAIHGGAGTIDESSMSAAERRAVHEALRQALAAGQSVLGNGGRAIDAVEAAVIALEDEPLFNAAYGACMDWNGTHLLDAAIMNGADKSAGAVASVAEVRNPVRAARHVLQVGEHVLLVGEAADAFAVHCGLEPVANSYFTTELRRSQWQQLRNAADGRRLSARDMFRFGTVGAVACDAQGHLAAATSTGGITCKRWGRVGDSPLIGAGTLADAHCAVSCSGAGELFIRHGVAHEISARLRLAGQSLAEAVAELLAGPLAIEGGSGGIIAVDAHGVLCTDFNTRGFHRGWVSGASAFCTAVESAVVEHER